MKKLLVILLMIFSLTITFEKIEAKSENLGLPRDLEKIVINELLLNSEELNLKGKKIELKFIRDLYHVDDTTIGYYTHVMEDNNLVGFALISANASLGNLLEWGSFENGIDTHYGDILNEKPQQKAYYLSLDDIVIANNLEHLNSILEKVKRERIKFAEENEPNKVQFYKEFKYGIDIREATKQQKEIQEQANKVNLLSNNTVEIPELQNELVNDGNSPMTLSDLPSSLTIVRLYQRMSGVAHPKSSCGPAVGAMIANYYRNIRGFTAVNNSATYGGDAKFINHMYYMSNSYFWGTNQYSFHNGIQTQLNLNKKEWIAKSRGYESGVDEPTFANIQNAINKRYPLALIRYAAVENNELIYHWTLIAAYNDSGQIGYYDPDGSDAGRKWVSWATLSGKVGYTYFALD